MATEWFIVVDDEEKGPFTHLQMVERIDRGLIGPETRIRCGDRGIARADAFLAETFARVRQSQPSTGPHWWKVAVAAAIFGALFLAYVNRSTEPKQPTGNVSTSPNAAPVTQTTFGQVVDGPLPPPVDRQNPSNANIIEAVEPGVVTINVERRKGARASGSGFLVFSHSLVATNFHVIDGASAVAVAFRDGTVTSADGWLGFDAGADVALIHIANASPSGQTLRASDTLPSKGDSVFTFGAPEGLGWTVTTGIVSAIRRGEEIQRPAGTTWIQTTAPMSHGSSGGPLVKSDGTVIGLNTWGIVGDHAQSLNFAAAVSALKKIPSNSTIRSFSELPTSRANASARQVQIERGTQSQQTVVSQEAARRLESARAELVRVDGRMITTRRDLRALENELAVLVSKRNHAAADVQRSATATARARADLNAARFSSSANPIDQYDLNQRRLNLTASLQSLEAEKARLDKKYTGLDHQVTDKEAKKVSLQTTLYLLSEEYGRLTRIVEGR